MRVTGRFVCFFLLFSLCSFVPQISHAGDFHRVDAFSAMVYDMATGKVLYAQNPDGLIAPASLTKILTLYLTWEAIESEKISLSDRVRVSRQAASMPDVRMGLKAGDIVTVRQLIKGMAVESGNDAAVAMAQFIGGSVKNFVAMMNAKARELGMTSTHFMTPNGLPARGQLTTARDILRLSIAYLRRFSGSLWISSMRSYTYHGKTDVNPNDLLGRCPGVDGLKTGFVCSSGFNIVATAIRDHVRIIAVVLGTRSAGVRRIDAESLIEAAYHEIGGPYYAVGGYRHGRAGRVRALAREAARCRVPTARRIRHDRLRPTIYVGRGHAARRRARIPSYAVRMRRLRARYEARRRRLRAHYEARKRRLMAQRSRLAKKRKRARSRAHKVVAQRPSARPSAHIAR